MAAVSGSLGTLMADRTQHGALRARQWHLRLTEGHRRREVKGPTRVTKWSGSEVMVATEEGEGRARGGRKGGGEERTDPLHPFAAPMGTRADL